MLTTIHYHVRSASAVARRYAGACPWRTRAPIRPRLLGRVSASCRSSLAPSCPRRSPYAIGEPRRRQQRLWFPSLRALAFSDAVVGVEDGLRVSDEPHGAKRRPGPAVTSCPARPARGARARAHARGTWAGGNQQREEEALSGACRAALVAPLACRPRGRAPPADYSTVCTLTGSSPPERPAGSPAFIDLVPAFAGPALQAAGRSARSLERVERLLVLLRMPAPEPAAAPRRVQPRPERQHRRLRPLAEIGRRSRPCFIGDAAHVSPSS